MVGRRGAVGLGVVLLVWGGANGASATPLISSFDLNPNPGNEGQSITFSGTATGNGSLHYDWNFGDGSSNETGIDLTTVFHTFADNGAYSVSLTVTDDDGFSTTQDTQFVNNVAPTVEAGPDQSVGTTLGLIASFSDPGSADTHSGLINWGDGGGYQPATVTGSHVAGIHTYSTAGNYTVYVRVADDDGAVSIDSMNVSIVPEPSTALLLAGGLAGLAVRRRSGVPSAKPPPTR